MEYKLIKADDKTAIRTNKIVTFSSHRWRAVFSWNDGELLSDVDFEIPLVGEGATEEEAIGCLMKNHSQI